MNVCLGCGEPIRWVLTERGRRMPLNPDPHPDGTVVVRLVDGRPRAHVLTGPELPAQEPAWRPHWVTCPSAPEFRARQGRTVARCTVCEFPLDPVLVAREPHHTTHPSCDPHAARARADWLANRARAAERGRNPR